MSDDVRNTQRWCSFYNASGETIPAYGVINLVSDKGASSDTVNFCRRLVAKQFSSDEDSGLYALNSRFPVPAGQYGECTFARSAPAFAAIAQVDLDDSVDISADDDWIGQDWGPVEEKWTIGSGTGFVLMARPDVDYVDGFSRVLVMAGTASDEDWLVTKQNDQYRTDDGIYDPDYSPGDQYQQLIGNRHVGGSGGDTKSDGIAYAMAASRVKEWHKGDDHQDFPEKIDPDYPEIVNAKWFEHLISAGELIYAKRRVYSDGEDIYTYWMPLRGGTSFFPYAKLEFDMDSEDNGDADPDNETLGWVYLPTNPLAAVQRESYGDEGDHGTYEHEIAWPPDEDQGENWQRVSVRIAAPITLEPIPGDTVVSLMWSAVNRKFVIIGTGCPEYTD